MAIIQSHNSIIPPIDLTNSREYYGTYKSRDFYKGTSFKMRGEWATNTHYSCDEYVVDFVLYHHALLSCKLSHLSPKRTENISAYVRATIPELTYDDRGNITGIVDNPYWAFVMAGTEGPEGKAWVPHISDAGVLTWSQEDTPPTEEFIIKGDKGEKGDKPIIDVREKDGKIVWTSDGEDILNPTTGEPLEAKGPKGDRGKRGAIYLPTPGSDGKSVTFVLQENPSYSSVSFDLSVLKGEKGDKGDSPKFAINSAGQLISYYGEDMWTSGNMTILGNVIGPKGDKGNKGDKGDKGDKGNVGPTQELKIEVDSAGMSMLYCRTKGTTSWTQLGPVGGMPGKSPKLIRVFDDPNTGKDDRILWGYDGVPVSEWTTLCYVDELKGDENIAYGCPADFDGGAPPIDKIWYDPCDDAVDQFSANDFLYESYVSTGGKLSKAEFEEAFANFGDSSGNYKSSLDPTIATVEKLGGIAAGTTVAQLAGKSYDEIFDSLLFPTVYPTFTAPSASISLNNYSNVQEVGANAPTLDNFNKSFNPGAIMLGGKKQNNRAGSRNEANSHIVYGSSQTTSLPAKVTLGAMDYYYKVAYAAGPQPKDSKGNNYQTPLAAGSVLSPKVTVTGYRASYYGLVSTNVITEEVIKSMNKNVSAKKTIRVSGPITEQYICLAVPVGWAVSNIKDSNNFDVTSSYTISTVSVTGLDGTAVNYTVYLSGKMTQPNTYYVNFN